MRLRQHRGIWYVFWTDNGQTKRRSLRTSDRDLAEQRLADHRRTPVGPTVNDMAMAYLQEKEHTSARPEGLQDALKPILPVMGHLRPDQIDRPLCRAYVKGRLRQGRQAGTINKELRILRAALRWHDKQTPAVFWIPSPPPPKSRHLTREEAGRLIEGCGSPHLELFVILALTTAGRARAILDLTWDRVDFKRKRIALADGTAGRKGRATVPMNATAEKALLEAHRARQTPFVIEYGEKPVGSVKKAFARAVERAGLEDVTPHVLRHTAAVWMAESGIPIPEISQYLGHTDSRVTERTYARYSPEYLSKAASVLEL